jgi:hypothetical protein
MDIVMPSTFPAEYREFGLATLPFFPRAFSDDYMRNPLLRAHFDFSWQAVRYRYRTCSETNEEFKSLLANPSESWQAGWGDEELTYRLERCIATFFMNGLSVFDSFVFCLYFLGHAIQPNEFPDVGKPRNITRRSTAKVFATAFPNAAITKQLAKLQQEPRFGFIDETRNIVGHRLSGRRGIRSSITLHKDGTHTTDFHEETWDLPGAKTQLAFDAELLQRHLDDITGLLTPLASAARDFANTSTPAKVSA